MSEMNIRRCVLALAAVLLVAADSPRTAAELALQKQSEETRKQLFETELNLEREKSLLRFAPDGSMAEATIRDEAKEAGLVLSGVKVIAGATAGPVEMRGVEFSGRDSYEKLHLLLHRLTFLGGVDVQELRVTAAPENTVAFSARLAYPVIVAHELPSSIPRATSREELLRQMIEIERAALKQKRETVNALLQAAPPDHANGLLNGLAGFIGELEKHAVAMTGMSVNDAVEVKGLAMGAKAVNGIKPALAKSGFEVVGLNLTRAGGCTAFSATARVANREHATRLAFDNALFDADAPAVCKSGSVAATDIVVKGTDPGGITMRLRGADVSTVFYALHETSPQNFAIDTSITRRFNVDVQNATVSDIGQKLRDAGLTISYDTIQRVSSKETSTTFREQEWTGTPPISVLLRDADLADLLCLFHEISALQILVPPGLHTKVSVFATDVPWDQAMSNVIAAAGLRYVIDNNRVYVGTNGGDPSAIDTCANAKAGVTAARVWWQPASAIENVAAADLVLAGAAGVDGEWKAYAYGPMRKLWPLAKGTRLFDARVESVGPNGATLKIDGGDLFELRF